MVRKRVLEVLKQVIPAYNMRIMMLGQGAGFPLTLVCARRFVWRWRKRPDSAENSRGVFLRLNVAVDKSPSNAPQVLR